MKLFIVLLVLACLVMSIHANMLLTNFDHVASKMDIPEADKTKLSADFARLKKAYCDPPTMDETKLKAVQACDFKPANPNPTIEKCRQEAMGNKSLDDNRKEKCQGHKKGKKSAFMECMKREGGKMGPRGPPPEFSQDSLGRINKVKDCLEKALA